MLATESVGLIYKSIARQSFVLLASGNFLNRVCLITNKLCNRLIELEFSKFRRMCLKNWLFAVLLLLALRGIQSSPINSVVQKNDSTVITRTILCNNADQIKGNCRFSSERTNLIAANQIDQTDEFEKRERNQTLWIIFGSIFAVISTIIVLALIVDKMCCNVICIPGFGRYSDGCGVPVYSSTTVTSSASAGTSYR